MDISLFKAISDLFLQRKQKINLLNFRIKLTKGCEFFWLFFVKSVEFITSCFEFVGFCFVFLWILRRLCRLAMTNLHFVCEFTHPQPPPHQTGCECVARSKSEGLLDCHAHFTCSQWRPTPKSPPQGRGLL